jgi:hypothetical protein
MRGDYPPDFGLIRMGTRGFKKNFSLLEGFDYFFVLIWDGDLFRKGIRYKQIGNNEINKDIKQRTRTIFSRINIKAKN